MKTKSEGKVKNLSVGDGKMPSVALKKYFYLKKCLSKARNKKNDENIDTNNETQNVLESTSDFLDKKCNDELEKVVTLKNDRIALKPDLEIVFWTNRKLQDSPGIESSEVFEGMFENRPITVKRTPQQVSHAALNEAAMLSKLVHHENIIRYLCKLEDPNHHYVITDSYQMSLGDFVKGNKSSDGLLPTKIILKQLCEAVEFLQRLKIISMSLNPHSVRVVSNNDVAKIKLTSFDFSAELLDNTKIHVGKDFKGVKGFVAPEIKIMRCANFTSDIFSMGCLYYYILTGGEQMCPVRGLEQERICFGKMQKFQERHKTCDGVLVALMIKKMLSFSGKRRPTISAIKSHPYFWNTHEIFDLILEIAKKSEDDGLRDQLKEKIEVNKAHVIGDSWKKKIDGVVLEEISKKRSYNETSIFHLVKAIRNQFAHGRCSPLLAQFFGNTKEELKDYWLGKFPQLIPHLCRVMKLMTSDD